MTPLLADIHYALRQLARRPGFALAAVATLALAAGLNGGVFSLVDALLFRPLPVSAPDRLVRLYSQTPGDLMSYAPMSLADVQELRAGCDGLASVAASWLTMMVLEDAADGRLVLAEPATPGYFQTLGVHAALGRTFGAGDDVSGGGGNPFGGAPVAVLSRGSWERRFGGDPGVVGRTVRLNGQAVVVIGVMPEGFFGLARGVSPEVWLPQSEALPGAAERGDRHLWGIARLKPGVSVAEAQAQVDRVARRLQHDFPDSHRQRTFAAVPSGRVRILPGLDAALYPASFAALALTALILLVAASSLAHLLLVRALARRSELATRLALGASRAALARQLLAEAGVIAGAGAGGGLALAAGASRVVRALVGALPVDVELGLAVDLPVVLLTLGATLAATLALALAPALAASRIDLAQALRGAGAEARRRWLRPALVTSQLALSLVLLIAAGLAARSLTNAGSVDPGFDPRGVVVASFAPRLQGYGTERAEALYDELLEDVRALPDTSAAGIADHLPLTVEVAYERAAAADDPREADAWPLVDSALVGPGYFAAMGIPLRGRGFAPADARDRPPVAVVNETLARRTWPHDDPIGRRLRLAGLASEVEVVGVAGDGKYRSLGEAPRPFLYRPFAQAWASRHRHAGEVATGTQTVVLRTRGDPGAALLAVRSIARRLDEQLAISRLETLSRATRLQLLLPRAAAELFGLLAATGLLLVAVGVAGVAAHAAGRRTREVGIRVALGASRRDVVALLMRESLGIVGVGLAAGLAGALALTSGLQALLYGIRPDDPLTYAAAAAFLAAVAALAGYLPARRAARLPPRQALRCD